MKHEARERRRGRIRVRGDAARPRAVVSRSRRWLRVQLVDDESGATLLAGKTAASKEAGTPVEQATALGKEMAAKAQETGIKAVVFDRAGFKYHGRVKAVAEGLREGGLSL